MSDSDDTLQLADFPNAAEVAAFSAAVRRRYAVEIDPQSNDFWIDCEATQAVASDFLQALNALVAQVSVTPSNGQLLTALVDCWTGVAAGINESAEAFRQTEDQVSPLLAEIVQTMTEFNASGKS